MFAKSLLMAGAALLVTPALAQETTAPSWTPEIIVTAERPANYTIGAASVTRTPVPLINTPQSIQVLTRTLLDEQQLFTLADAVRNISGVVTALPSEAVLANPIVRGFESEVFVDGLIAYGDTAVVDPSSLSGVERIEVAKGPTSLLFGGGTGAAYPNSKGRTSTSGLAKDRHRLGGRANAALPLHHPAVLAHEPHFHVDQACDANAEMHRQRVLCSITATGVHL